MAGVGMTTGLLPTSECWRELGFTVLECDECGATWAGPHRERCQWCLDGERAQQDEQRRMLLTGPQGGDFTSWARRLVMAVGSGLVDEEQAERAVRKELMRRGK